MRHSKLAATPATRGGRTISEGAVAIPQRSISLSSAAKLNELAFIASTIGNGTRLTTNSPVCSIFRAVSLRLPFGCSKGEIIRVGGEGVIIWKKLNGARLVTPAAEQVDTQATGLGVMVEAIQK